MMKRLTIATIATLATLALAIPARAKNPAQVLFCTT